jgi:uncharacterized protein YndB with AHSA1/START domain
MAKQLNPNTDTTGRELLISRLIAASPEQVWEVWTKPEHIKHWWGPTGFTNTIYTMDVQPGGVWEFVMHGPDGRDYKNKSVFAEVVKYKRLVFDHVSGPIFRATVTFEAQGDKTLITWRMVFETVAQFEQVVKQFKADEGQRQNIEKLEAYLKSPAITHTLTLKRILPYPVETVYKAWTEPEQLANWWGPLDFTNPVCQWEAKPGGKIYIDMLAGDGTHYPMDGVFTTVTENSKLIFTCGPVEKDGSHPFEVENNISFIPINGTTEVVLVATISKIKPAATPYLKGMEEGWSQSLDKLKDHFANYSATPVVLERLLNAPIALVWDALTNKDEMKKWYFDLAAFKPEMGFKFQFTGGTETKQYLHLCEVTALIPGKKIQYSWRYDGYPGISFVSFELFAVDKQTRLVLTHTGLESFPPENPDFAKHNFVAGWNHIIGISLPGYIESKV